MKLIAKNIYKSFKKKPVLNDISLEISSGEIVCLRGKSGSGKTTLLNILGLLESPDSGNIFIDHKKVDTASKKQKTLLYRNLFGFLFQNYGLIDEWTVSKNLDFGLEYSKLSKNEKLKLKHTALKSVGLSDRISSPVYELSGGEQQRVALARLMLKKPKIILCDEPSAALDDENTKIVINALIDFAKSGGIVVISTHDKAVSDRCDKIFTLEE
jgi:putative ABC transport system ATP-binding protein